MWGFAADFIRVSMKSAWFVYGSFTVTVSLTDEVLHANLGDQRLNKRLGKIIEQLGERPERSIPAATVSRASMEAAYRFFSNDSVTPSKILQPHFDATCERISQCDRVLLVQDTTELDLTRPSQQVLGAGPMDSNARRGAFAHLMIAFSSTGLPLGTVWHKIWAREHIETSLSDAERVSNRQNTPIEQKESIRWIEGLRHARDVAAACPNTQCICVSDSESDIYEMFAEPRSNGDDESLPKVHLLIRACQNRSTTRGNWLDDVRATPCLLKSTLHVSARTAKIKATKHKREQSRDARSAQVEIRAAAVTLRPPYRVDRDLPPVTVNLVLVEETNAPEGCEPIRWILATTLPIDNEEEVQMIIESYCQRWQIEIFFKTLKSGCNIEKRLFEQLPHVLNCLAVCLIIAWRVMYLCRIGGECPDLCCEVVFCPSEWKSVYSAIHYRKPLPKKPPRLQDMIDMVASLGGYIKRGDSRPGTKTLWIGLEAVHFLTLGWESRRCDR